ncbi:unnamed protein product [Macrosiphum euphorbiae]|uniref:PiggyBac transposable element-derived protein domain-containing protein n=1 Tax=Macrosiphum euphorbiae TaxID=13131 RepID=A0AAV0WDS9_9HEMI|nr:unnamed protein product [Macrosiphum euphorbiae]
MELYTGKQKEGPYKISNSATDVVLRLSRPIYDSGRNITADNWFSSIPLAKELLEKIKKNCQYNLFLLKIEWIISPCLVLETNDNSFIHTKKKNKNVIMLSIMHLDGSISEQPEHNSKPEIILFYNNTGVHTIDEMCSTYSVSRKVRRWPLVLFFRLIDLAGINAEVIFSTNNRNNKLIRRKFLEEVGLSLLKVSLKKRAVSKYIPRSLRQKASKSSGEEKLPECSKVVGIRGRCAVCPRDKDIKTTNSCQLYMCQVPQTYGNSI